MYLRLQKPMHTYDKCFRVRSVVAKDQRVATGTQSSRLRKGQNSWPPHKSTHTIVGRLARGLLLQNCQSNGQELDYDRDARCKSVRWEFKIFIFGGDRGGFPNPACDCTVAVFGKNRVRLNWRTTGSAACDTESLVGFTQPGNNANPQRHF